MKEVKEGNQMQAAQALTRRNYINCNEIKRRMARTNKERDGDSKRERTKGGFRQAGRAATFRNGLG